MLANTNRIDELFPEEVILFNESGHPYYASPAASDLIWDNPNDASLFNEIVKIVDTVSMLKLKLSYELSLRSSPDDSEIQCNVSKFGFGYKVVLNTNDVSHQLHVGNSSKLDKTSALRCV